MMDDKFITEKDEKHEKHEKYINILDNILIPDFDGYKITSILFNDIWFSFNMKFSYIIKHVLARLITNYLV